MNKKQKIITATCVVACAGCVAAGVFFSKRNHGDSGEAMAYVMSVSSMNEMAGTQRLAGIVESQKTLDIQKDTEREIKEILVKAGDEVDVGTPLFTYDTATLETDIQQAQLDLERADNSMGNLKAQIQQLQKEKKKASSDEQLSYTTQIQSAEMDLKKSEYERKAKEVELNRLKSKVENSTVTSEMKGVVKSVSTGQNSGEMSMYEGSGQAFMTILATGEYRVKGKVNEQNASQVMEGARAIIRSRVDENMTWQGTYTAVDTQNPNNSNNNMMYGMSSEDAAQTTSTSYPFYVELDSSDGLLLGQHVYIEQDSGMEEREKGIWLDEAFIADMDKKPYIWTETEKGTLEKRTVVLGTYDENMMQYKIEEGLEKSDYVAYPQEFLEEGMKTTHDPAEAMADPAPEGEILPEGEELPEGEMQPEGEALPEGEMQPEDEALPEEDVVPEGEPEDGALLPEEEGNKVVLGNSSKKEKEFLPGV